MKIRNMLESDWNAVAKIYQDGINTNMSTFGINCPSYSIFDESHIKDCRFVAVDNGVVIGWSTLSNISSRCVYVGVAEISIYVDNERKNTGIGTTLLMNLLAESEKLGFWMLQSSIRDTNIASAKLHEKCGFRLVGYREKIGKDRFGNWQNTVLYEKRNKIM